MDDDDVLKPEPPSMAWLLTFADLVSLMITFFVLLFSMKVPDAQKWADIQGSMVGTFAVRKPVVDTQPDKIQTLDDLNLVEADNLAYVESILATRFREDPSLEGVEVRRDHKKDALLISLPSTLLFEAGSSLFLDEGYEAISSLGDVLRHLDNNIEVAGHTDPSPIQTPVFPTNWELAMLRSISVVKLLQEQGMSGSMAAVSYGASRFSTVAPYLPEEERHSRARKVEIVIHGDQG